MNKLYVFGIGGTGSRVLKSLTMLLASGAECKYDVIPIIIDSDLSNGNLSDAELLMDSYRNIRKELNFNEACKNKFFKTCIGFDNDEQNNLDKLARTYEIPLNGTNDESFSDFLGLSSMSRSNQAITKMLFSGKNLKSDMNKGFKGNPNIGSVVLNQIKTSEAFKQFTTSFSEGDKIFIISSIFGGTGASGFPLLFKIFRTDENIPSHALINKASIGAITVLPYFKVQPDDKSEIDSNTFMSKTIAALSYYYKTLGTKKIELYYVADDQNIMYSNNDGGQSQRNDAHIVEFLAATSILHFAGLQSTGSARYWELGIKYIKETESVNLTHFYDKMSEMFYDQLVHFMMLSKYLEENLNNFGKTNKAKDLGIQNIESTPFISELKEFSQKYIKWLKELSGNKRSFIPFNLKNMNKPFDLITKVEPRRIRNVRAFMKSDYSLFDSWINNYTTDRGYNESQKFMELLYQAIEDLAKSKQLCYKKN